MSSHTLPFVYRVALGNEHGKVNKFGQQGSVGTSEIAIWDVAAAYSYLSAASVLKISSSDAADTSAGTGARTIEIQGLDGDYAPLTETVTLNGQTAVNTTGEFLRVFRMKVMTVGSGGENAGTVYAGTGTVTSGVPANKYAAISIGENQTLMSIYTVPAGKTALLTTLYVSGDASKTVTCWLKARPLGEVFRVKEKFLITEGNMTISHGVPVAYAAKTDIEVRGKVSTGTTEISAAFDLILVDQ